MWSKTIYLHAYTDNYIYIKFFVGGKNLPLVGNIYQYTYVRVCACTRVYKSTRVKLKPADWSLSAGG